jgi:hypothetical protein
MEHRWGTRIPVNVPVRISSASLSGTGRLRDLSVSGAYIETALALPASAWVQVQVARGTQPVMRLSGLVIRRDGHGIGIEWLDLAPLELAPSLLGAPHDETTIISGPTWPAASLRQPPLPPACS